MQFKPLHKSHHHINPSLPLDPEKVAVGVVAPLQWLQSMFDDHTDLWWSIITHRLLPFLSAHQYWFYTYHSSVNLKIQTFNQATNIVWPSSWHLDCCSPPPSPSGTCWCPPSPPCPPGQPPVEPGSQIRITTVLIIIIIIIIMANLDNPAGKSAPDGKTGTAVHPLLALEKTCSYHYHHHH